MRKKSLINSPAAEAREKDTAESAANVASDHRIAASRYHDWPCARCRSVGKRVNTDNENRQSSVVCAICGGLLFRLTSQPDGGVLFRFFEIDPGHNGYLLAALDIASASAARLGNINTGLLAENADLQKAAKKAERRAQLAQATLMDLQREHEQRMKNLQSAEEKACRRASVLTAVDTALDADDDTVYVVSTPDGPGKGFFRNLPLTITPDGVVAARVSMLQREIELRDKAITELRNAHAVKEQKWVLALGEAVKAVTAAVNRGNALWQELITLRQLRPTVHRPNGGVAIASSDAVTAALKAFAQAIMVAKDQQ